MDYSYTVILRKEPEGGYTVLVPALPGCLTEGETAADALVMAQDAIRGYLESLRMEGEAIPRERKRLTFEPGDMDEGFFFRVKVSLPEPTPTYA